MTDPDLPADLAELERRLAERSRVEPPPELGPRVLAAARAALRHPATPSALEGWRFWAAVAATVLLAVNLSMSVSADTDWEFANEVAARPDPTAELRALAPELPDAELRRQALLTRAAGGLTPAALPPLHITSEEPTRWDVR
jgi:hypothetical protein